MENRSGLVAQLNNGFVTMVTIEDENTNTLLQCLLSIRRRCSNYQRTGVTILWNIFWVNRDFDSTNAWVISVSQECLQRKISMAVPVAKGSVLHDVHLFQGNKYQFCVVFVAVQILNVNNTAIRVVLRHSIISELGWYPPPDFVGL